VREVQLLSLLNSARLTAAATPLKSDPELREIALSHSSDMAENRFFGHVSPKHGDIWDRVERWGVLAGTIGENVGRASTPEQVHELLMASPGHLVNMVRPRFTHVGIAVEAQDEQLFATYLFAWRPAASALPTSAAQVETAILTLRRKQGLSQPKLDPIYRASAGAGAQALLETHDRKLVTAAIERAMQAEVDRRQSERPATCLLMLYLMALEQLEDHIELKSPSLRRLGVGVRLKQDAKGSRLATVVVLEDPDHCK
jgi:hypothetical protein